MLTGQRPAGGAARRVAILEALTRTGFVSVTALADRFRVSEMTVRRDLKALSAAGEVTAVHGGASLPHGTLRTAGFSARARENHEGKRVVAHLALTLVDPHDAVLIDAGTTAFELAAALPATFTGTVITHSAPVVQHMLRLTGARAVCLGGELSRDSQAFVGEATIAALAHWRARTAFIGAAAVSRSGVYIETDLERPTKHALARSAERVVLLATTEKLATRAPVRLFGLDDVDVVVLDGPPCAEVAEALQAAGTELLLPD